MKILGLITARGGSKGIPGKNIKQLGHQPLIAYVINDGKASKNLSRLIVSTDDPEILKVAVDYGADVPFLRPPELALDQTPSIEVVKHALRELESQGEKYDAVCLLQPTSPFKPSGFLDECICKFIRSEADSLISVLEVPHEYNPHWTFEMDSDGHLAISTGETKLIPRRQELPKAFHRDGSIYITSTRLIQSQNLLVGGKLVGINSDPKYYSNLDTPFDWQKAEQTYQRLY